MAPKTPWTEEEMDYGTWRIEQLEIWDNQLPEAPPTPTLEEYRESVARSSTDPWTPEQFNIMEEVENYDLTPNMQQIQEEEEEEDPFGHGFELE